MAPGPGGPPRGKVRADLPQRLAPRPRGDPRDFIFVDDNIIADPAYARRLFRELAPLGRRWVSQCSIDIADDPELLGLARDAGCVGLFIGLESADGGNLTAVGKAFNESRRYEQRIAAIRGAGIGVIAGIIVGMDHDDARVFEETLRLLRRLRIDALQLNIMTPLPGTPLFDDFARQGRIADRSWRHYDFRHCVIQPARMSARDLQDGADWLYRQFYRLDRILLRFLSGLATCGPVPAWLGLKLNLAYRADNRRERVRGRKPAAGARRAAASPALPQAPVSKRAA